jgi:hypothetical protein
MKNKLGIDSFVYKYPNSNRYTLSEQYSEGAWIKDETPVEILKSGIMFRPNSNVLYDDFLTQKDQLFCITVINSRGQMLSFPNLTHEQAIQIIEDNINDLEGMEDGQEVAEGYLTIFNMKDGITFEQYEKELEIAKI